MEKNVANLIAFGNCCKSIKQGDLKNMQTSGLSVNFLVGGGLVTSQKDMN